MTTTTSETIATRRRRRPRLAAIAVGLVGVLVLSGCIELNKDQEKNQGFVNSARVQHGRSRLPIHPQAQIKAQAWAEKLAREGRIYHSELTDGITVRWCGLAENVGTGPNTESVFSSFMGSSGHRANILNGSWNGVGIGVARNGSRAYVVHVFIRTC